jgi:hypothetical protein
MREEIVYAHANASARVDIDKSSSKPIISYLVFL